MINVTITHKHGKLLGKPIRATYSTFYDARTDAQKNGYKGKMSDGYTTLNLTV